MTSEAELIAEIERLKKENDALKTLKGAGLTIRASQKGGVSVFGLGRFPVILYKSQWIRLLSVANAILDFIETNKQELADK